MSLKESPRYNTYSKRCSKRHSNTHGVYDKCGTLNQNTSNEKINSTKAETATRKPLDFYSHFSETKEVKEYPAPKPYEPKAFYNHFSFNECESTKTSKNLANYKKALQQKFKELELDNNEDDKKANKEKSSTAKIVKPEVSFLQRYRSMCASKKLTGLQLFSIIKFKSPYELNINVDKIRFKEWNVFCDTLKADTTLKKIHISSYKSYLNIQHTISSKELCKTMNINTGLGNTKYGLETLLHALGLTILTNSNLRILEFTGLYLNKIYLNYVTEAFSYSSIIDLSLINCPIGDKGCLTLCTALKQLKRLKNLELNKCSLTEKSGIYIADLLKFKYLQYSTKCWENNLRDTIIDPNEIGGILKLTLNNNPQLSNDGVLPILTCLVDNESIKSIEMQYCGITADIENEIFITVTGNTSLIVADFRYNSVGKSCIEELAGILKARAPKNSPYRWCPPLRASTCDTVSSLKTLNPSRSNSLNFSNIDQSRFPRMRHIFRSSPTTLIDMRTLSPDRLSNAASSSLSRHSTVSLASDLNITIPHSSTSTRTNTTESDVTIRELQNDNDTDSSSKTETTSLDLNITITNSSTSPRTNTTELDDTIRELQNDEDTDSSSKTETTSLDFNITITNSSTSPRTNTTELDDTIRELQNDNDTDSNSETETTSLDLNITTNSSTSPRTNTTESDVTIRELQNEDDTDSSSKTETTVIDLNLTITNNSTSPRTNTTDSDDTIRELQNEDDTDSNSKTEEINEPRDITSSDLTDNNMRTPSQTSININDKDSENASKVEPLDSMSKEEMAVKYDYIPKVLEALSNLKSYSLETLNQTESEDADRKSED